MVSELVDSHSVYYIKIVGRDRIVVRKRVLQYSIVYSMKTHSSWKYLYINKKEMLYINIHNK